jgi:hypothetical protein
MSFDDLAQQIKNCRELLVMTQEDFAFSINKISSKQFNVSIVSNIESLTISPLKAEKLRPDLIKWLKNTE